MSTGLRESLPSPCWHPSITMGLETSSTSRMSMAATSIKGYTGDPREPSPPVSKQTSCLGLALEPGSPNYIFTDMFIVTDYFPMYNNTGDLYTYYDKLGDTVAYLAGYDGRCERGVDTQSSKEVTDWNFKARMENGNTERSGIKIGHWNAGHGHLENKLDEI